MDTVGLSCSVRAPSAPSEKRSDTTPCSALRLLITLVITCACGGCVPSKPSPPRCPVWSPAIRLIWTLRFKLSFLCMNLRDRRSQRTWIDSNTCIEQLRVGFPDRHHDRGCPDDIELPYKVSPHLPALLLMSNASDAVFRVKLLLRAKLLLCPIV